MSSLGRDVAELVLGVDGGGTKTRATILDEKNEVLGEGNAGPSNPLRVGVGSAVTAIRSAFDKACEEAGLMRSEITAAQIGLAGVRREDLRQSMREALKKALRIRELDVVTDAEIALYGATSGEQGLVVIAGTGSICCGKEARGRRACAGGWGPLAGDEGSGSWIARRALQAVAQAADGRGPQTSLSKAACDYFNLPTPEDLSMAIYAPSMTNERIAGFGRHVIEAAREGDEAAHKIITQAGEELGVAACAVIRKLKLERERFQVAYVGGVFTADELVLAPLRVAIKRVAPRAFLAPPLLTPSVAAARMAREHLKDLAVAV
ncbi:MAG TPA: BadF/BadG/BcrA/BcrD ATPase family protein [Pyrinomonadaceae bacterium]|jgi:N-acetylglucosamine kinase-like BadF-type ATPase